MSLRDRQERARAIVRAAGSDALLATDPGTVWWLTGHAVDIETGPSPFASAPAVVLAGDEPAWLVVSDDDGAVEHADVDVHTYEGFTAGPLRGPSAAREVVTGLLAGRSVVEDQAGAPRSVHDELLRARAVKDPDEIDLLRAALRATDAGQRRLREVAVPGATELEVFGAVRTAIESVAGARAPLLADLVSGPRTAEMGGPPTNRVLAAGELVLCDLAPRVGGVWGDSCATIAVGGTAAATHERAHARVREAFDRALDSVRPGVGAAQLDAVVRADLGYPHHTGHGLGGSYHEEPRIVPSADTILVPGMVIAVEPGLYGQANGIRLEHVLLVTTDGCEDLSEHALTL